MAFSENVNFLEKFSRTQTIAILLVNLPNLKNIIILSSILCPLWTLFLIISVEPALSQLKYNETIKDQLISKCLFGVFQKTDENKSTSSNVEFVRSFFGRNVSLKESFRICLTFRRVPSPRSLLSFCLFKQAKTQEDTS